jgi:alpha,alpha-trehalose phosphorylase
VQRDRMSVEVLEGEPVDFSVRGAAYRATLVEPVEIGLVGQGPFLPGAPRRPGANSRRDDGSLMTATVPTLPGFNVD